MAVEAESERHSPIGRGGQLITRTDLNERITEWGIREDVDEKDYVIGWALWEIGADPMDAGEWAWVIIFGPLRAIYVAWGGWAAFGAAALGVVSRVTRPATDDSVCGVLKIVVPVGLCLGGLAVTYKVYGARTTLIVEGIWVGVAIAAGLITMLLSE